MRLVSPLIRSAFPVDLLMVMGECLQKRFLTVILASGQLTGSPAGAAEVELLQPLRHLAILEPEDHPLSGIPSYYAVTGPNPNWNVGQWNIPGGKLSAFETLLNGVKTVSKATSAEAQVELESIKSENPVLRLRQDGTVLPCSQGGSPRESDLFFGPNNRVRGLQSGMVGGNPTILSSIVGLPFSVTYVVHAGVAHTPRKCAVNRSIGLVGIVLTNSGRAASAPQTLFYQLWLSRYCVSSPARPDPSCDTRPSRPLAFFLKNPFGVDDYLPLSGTAFVASDERARIKLDLKPRLKSVIENGPSGIDPDLSHWRIEAVYFGQCIWGSVVQTTIWSDFSLKAIYP